MDDNINRQELLDLIDHFIETKNDACKSHSTQFVDGMEDGYYRIRSAVCSFPSARQEAVPHRNYKYLSDYWCECGWHLGKMGDVNFCANCGKKVKWDG